MLNHHPHSDHYPRASRHVLGFLPQEMFGRRLATRLCNEKWRGFDRGQRWFLWVSGELSFPPPVWTRGVKLVRMQLLLCSTFLFFFFFFLLFSVVVVGFSCFQLWGMLGQVKVTPRSRPCTNWSGRCMYGFGEIEPKVWVPSLKTALSFVPLATRE